ncbi:M1 family metallopeptidase [Aridibaculum aurantiacum]|uniref:M1 family metallopeptidase n=1 Tax=Aridibaculum aurantiacum TaxID=2810307 RepID=UPI001F6162BA|nr:M1 family metallopeptidase [Aridibaculum aurantiacum]
MIQRLTVALFAVLFFTNAQAQPDRWQQRISYNIEASLDVQTNQLTGTEKIDYYNNSPDTLNRVFFHMYWNAFQPNSSMDVRSREYGNIVLGKDREGKDVRDWDRRVRDRIYNLKPDEVGFQKAVFVKVNGKNQQLKEHETILEVVLDRPILPKSKTSFEVSFVAQVPLQIRRAGRDNEEGVRYSMSQWYPKMVEYDYQGWHANPYIAREFYGVWGDYNVKLTLDKSYMVAATGTLANADQIGFGYTDAAVRPASNAKTLTWNFVAQNVHDFAWAADPTYTMIKRQVKNGPMLYIVHKKDQAQDHRWKLLADTVELAFPVMMKTFGPYPYKTYAFIQAGDGGMEYPLATFVKGPGIGTAIHEWMHSWFQMMLGTNESLHHWMDEGFTTYASERVLGELRGKTGFVQEGSYNGYFRLVRSGLEEPASTHADHFNTNYAYSNASYSKGAVFITQLGYIVGDSVRDKILLDYYWQWRFKHPNPNDFIRVAEKASGIELDWYKEYWINSTKTIDYALDSLWEEEGKTKIRIRRVKEMPMPIDVQLTFKDGSKEMHNIPLNLMYGAKPVEDKSIPTKVHTPWKWTHPTYVFETNRKLFDLSELHIDPSQRLADVDRKNNVLKIQW